MDNLYYAPPPKAPTTLDCWGITAMVFVFIFSLITIVFMPIDFAAISMSIDPGFTGFFLIILSIFLLKIACVICFYIVLFMQLATLRTVCIIILIIGEVVIFLSMVVVGAEIYILTQSVMALCIHPFMIDFLFFVLADAFTLIVACRSSSSTVEYIALPQQQMFSNEQIEMMKLKPSDKPVVEEPKEKVEVPVVPSDYPLLEQPQPPTLPVEQMVVMDPQFAMFQPLPVYKKPVTQQKKPIVSFVPYYIGQ